MFASTAHKCSFLVAKFTGFRTGYTIFIYDLTGGGFVHIPFKISVDHPEPLYHQIKTQLKEFIVSGYLPPDTQLPSLRKLAKQLECSVITIRRVYDDLEQEGLLSSKQGKGTFVNPELTVEREEYTYDTIKTALDNVIAQCIRMNLSKDETSRIFNEVLAHHFDH